MWPDWGEGNKVLARGLGLNKGQEMPQLSSAPVKEVLGSSPRTRPQAFQQGGLIHSQNCETSSRKTNSLAGWTQPFLFPSVRCLGNPIS